MRKRRGEKEKKERDKERERGHEMVDTSVEPHLFVINFFAAKHFLVSVQFLGHSLSQPIMSLVKCTQHLFITHR